MNVLFLTMNVFTDIEMHNIYSDLMKEFVRHGHRPYIVTPREKKLGEKTELIDYPEYSLLKVQIGNTSNISLIEKGISTVTLSSRYFNAVVSKLGHIKIDLILYSTPPITLAAPVQKLKKHYKCRTYLMLKDIFPQNAVDLEMFSAHSPIYRYFRFQEKKLYRVSDRIGCMSQANVDYLLKHNPEISPQRVEICPNSIEPRTFSLTAEEKAAIREKYGIPLDKKVFVYGGNLGKPQGIPFIIDCLRTAKDVEDAFFLIAGDGTEYHKIKEFVQSEQPSNVALLNKLPRADYDKMIVACDVGLIFLDHRFTIPNFPSRLLSYMQAGLPVLACTDPNTDIGKVIVEGGFGWWCESSDPIGFIDLIRHISIMETIDMGRQSGAFLESRYSAEVAYHIIMGEQVGKNIY